MRRSLLTLAAVVIACGDPISPPRSASISVSQQTLLAGTSLEISGAVSGDAIWSVNGIAGGNERVGTISNTGVYTAPADVPTGNPVRLRIASAANPADSASATLIITPGPLLGDWVAWQPRIVNAARTDSMSLVVHVPAGITSVDLVPPGQGATARTFRRLTGQLFQVDFPASLVTSGYRTGDYHKFVGFIDTFVGTVRQRRGNGHVSVRDATMPDAAAVSLAPDAVATTRVFNLRVDHVPELGVAETQATRRFFELMPDNFDFIAIVQPLTFFQNRYYLSVRNSVTGIGIPRIDQGSAYGSAATLQGVIHYPIDSYFDLGEQAANHEIGHRWINFLSNTSFSTGIPHWPVSSVASGVMGWSVAGGQGGTFHRDFRPNGDGTYTVVAAADTGGFRDLELYLMGMLPIDSVGTHVVFSNTAQPPSLGATLTPVASVTPSQLIAQLGPRAPAYGASQTTFRVATIVLSAGRLLGADELAFFHHMASRGEATERLRFTSGFSSGMSQPFFVATGGRGRLITAIR